MISMLIEIIINVLIKLPHTMALAKGMQYLGDCECINCRLSRMERMIVNMEESIDKMIEECEKANNNKTQRN